MKHVLKKGIILLIESDGNITTLIVRTSKKTILKVLDVLIPDETTEKKG
jgi:hypothetical protein